MGVFQLHIFKLWYCPTWFNCWYKPFGKWQTYGWHSKIACHSGFDTYCYNVWRQPLLFIFPCMSQ